jgi:pantoate--beta-alanine ligase
MVKVLETAEAAADWSQSVRQAGQRLALVPTMGFLHAGHLSLMREGRARADVTAASIFVNPTQFGPKEDFSRYPRDLDGDLAKCEEAGVSAVFVPDQGGVYPSGFQTFVEVTEVSKGLDGDRRPGHFRGVATVVTKLLCLFRPHVALFGEKDYQQLQVVKALARDLNLGVEILGMPTVRETDGLALSSRNSYLSADERRRALALSRGMRAASHLFANGVRDTRELVLTVRRELELDNIREDYIAVVDAVTLEPMTAVPAGRAARLLVAGFLGTTRLIDNTALGG